MTLEEEIDELIEKENNGVGSIDLFFDYMKTRTCENCKHSGWIDGLLCAKQVCFNVEGGIDNHPYVEEDFGCNKFERKEDE